MDIDLSTEDLEFKQEVRDFFEENQMKPLCFLYDFARRVRTKWRAECAKSHKDKSFQFFPKGDLKPHPPPGDEDISTKSCYKISLWQSHPITSAVI